MYFLMHVSKDCGTSEGLCCIFQISVVASYNKIVFNPIPLPKQLQKPSRSSVIELSYKNIL